MAYEIPPFNSKTRRRMGTRTINYENWYNNVNNPYAYLYGIDDSPLMQFETLQGDPVERIKIDTQPNQFQIDFTDADQMIDENLYNPASEPPEYSASDQKSNSKFNWKGIGDLATTAAGHIADIVNSTKSTITIPKYTNYHADSINNLSDLGNMHKTYLNKDTLLQEPTAKTFFGDFFKKSTEGAIAGSSLGPWGILGGAIGGGLASIGNIAAKRSTYNKDLNAISRFNRLENIAFNNAYNTGLNNIIDNKNHSMYKQRLIGNYNAAGGPLGSEEQMGVTTFNTGGTHEMNQNGGIPQGIGDNGNTNLVEEGEVKWNDFIFSNRIQPSADILSKYNTMFNKKFNSYADAANFILDLHKERENNPFDKSTLNVQMQRLADAQEYQKLSDEAAQYGLTPEEYMEYQQQSKQYENGGNLYPNGGQLYYDAVKRQIVNTQPQHNYWVPITQGKSGKNYNGVYNFNSPFYSEFWNTLTPEDQAEMKNQFKNWYFSDGYQPTNIYGTNTPYNKWPNQNISIDDLYNEAINDKWGSVHQAWIDWMYNQLQNKPVVNNTTTWNIPEPLKTTTDIKQRAELPNDVTQIDKFTTTDPQYPWYYDALRTAPIWNNLRAVLIQNNPDYTYANQIASIYRPISSYPVGQYQRYQPVDQHYLDTQANQRANTQYGFYKNNAQSASAANAYATLAAANQSAAVNDAYIRALQTNNQNRNAALQYNNQLDRANEEARRATQAANYSNYANIMGNSYAAAEQERLAVENARESNMQNLAMNLGDLGRELYDRWRINNDPSLSYTTGWKYKQIIPLLNMWNDMMNEYNKTTKSK